MNVATISAVARILAGIKINRMTDRGAKAILLKDYLAVRKVAKEADDERDEIIDKFQQDWRDAMEDKSKQDEAYATAEADANNALAQIDEREVELELPKFPADALYDPDIWGDDIVLAQIPGTIDFLVENGLAE